MAARIIWSAFAETQLEDIYDYCETKVSSRVVTKLVKEIINAPKKLIKAPFIGQDEALLKKIKIHYRYLVFKN